MGMSFFSGLFNTMYYSKMKSYVYTTSEALDLKLKLLKTDKDDEEVKENPELCEQLSRLYRSFYLWLDEAKILDSTLYIPALSPAHGPDKLLRLLEGDDTLWLEYVDRDSVDEVSTAAVKEWENCTLGRDDNLSNQRPASSNNSSQSNYSILKLHPRLTGQEPSRSTRSPYCSSTRDLPPAERIIKRLTSYDPRVPGPVLRSSANRPPPVPAVAVAGLTEPGLEPVLLPHLQALADLAESFGNNHRAYGSLNCAHAELCPRLWGEVN